MGKKGHLCKLHCCLDWWEECELWRVSEDCPAIVSLCLLSLTFQFVEWNSRKFSMMNWLILESLRKNFLIEKHRAFVIPNSICWLGCICGFFFIFLVYFACWANLYIVILMRTISYHATCYCLSLKNVFKTIFLGWICINYTIEPCVELFPILFKRYDYIVFIVFKKGKRESTW